MIDVKEMHEDNGATAQAQEEVRKSWGGKAAPFRVNVPIESKAKGWNNPYAFRDPAEMVTISADRFEELIRQNEDLRNRLTSYENQLNAISSLVDEEAMKYAEIGGKLPSWGDTYNLSKVIHWTEPAGIREVRLQAEQAAKEAKEAERLAKHLQEVKENGEATD